MIQEVFNLVPNLKLSLLKRRGLKIGKNCYIGSNVSFDQTFCNLITIGDNTTIAARTIILAHDASTGRLSPYAKTKKASVTVGHNCFIGVGSIILPSVTIGDYVVVAAGSVVTKDLPSNGVYGGNPAKFIETIAEFKNKRGLPQ